MPRDLFDDRKARPRDPAVGGWPTWRDRLADPREPVVVGPGWSRAARHAEPALRGRRIPVVESADQPAPRRAEDDEMNVDEPTADTPTQLAERPPADLDAPAPPPPATATPAGDLEANPPGERRPEQASTAQPGAAAPPGTDLDAGRARLRDALLDLEEAKRRVERDAARVQEQTRVELCQKLLPVLDNLELSLQAAEASSDPAVGSGLRLVREQFEGVLRGFGLERFDAVGEPFDPNVHEAVGTVEVASPAESGRVVQQWQAGYRIGDRVLRAAKVQVGKLPQ